MIRAPAFPQGRLVSQKGPEGKMTSIYFDPEQFAPPSDPEPRDQLIVGGRYSLPPIGDPTGKRRSLQRVTNFVKQLADTGGLERWKLRMTVIGLARDERRYDLACSLNPDSERGRQELDKLIEECIDLGQAGPSGGNITGTALHNYTDDVAGSYPIRVRDKWVPKLENYQRALHAKGLRVVPGLQERLVISERYGTCGRLDDVYEDPFGTLRVADRKSQKEFRTWWEIGAQLALYQCSDAMWNEAECRWEDMPALAGDIAHIAWMPLSHPNGGTPRGSADDVTIYDIPLEGPREVLEYCARVRELRTGARKWGQERPNLNDFARVARDIRDAETHDDLRALAPQVSSDALYEMAAKRWEELAAQEKPEPVATPLNDTVRVATTSNYTFGKDETTLTVRGTQESIADLAAAAFGPGVTQQLSPDPATRALQYMATDLVAPPAEVRIMPQRITTQGYVSAEAIGFDPALFGPPSQDATFPSGDTDNAMGEGGASGLDTGGPALTEPRPDLGISAGAVKFTHSKHEDATTVHLPGDGPIATSANDRATAIEALGTVPIKIVREVRDRAHNSKSSRGRVRLLNDVEENKYAAHGVELLPALLREWLSVDGQLTQCDDVNGLVANTGGSKRAPMLASAAGSVSLSEYLATKDGEAPKSPAAGEGAADAVRGDEPDAAAPDVARAAQIEAAVERFVDEVAEVRKPYHGLSEGANAGKHSIIRLIELAKDARNGAERAKVFHEITRRKAWTGEIAAEINQHYLDNGYATEDFDPYFEAIAIEGSALPLDPDDPGTVDDAIHLLEGVKTLAELQAMWTDLGQRPYFHDARLQEALMARFANVKA